MNFVQRISNICNKSLSSYHLRSFHISSLIYADKDVKLEKEDDTVFDILEELREPDLTEEEILQKQFKARLPERVYRKFVLKQALPIEAKYDFKMVRLRKYYARHGKDSKLNPGICWPSREEILEKIKYDEMFEPPLQVRMKNVEEACLAKEKLKREYEEEVDKNMGNLDRWIAEHEAKIARKQAEILELKRKKEKLVDEISEYLGYDIDPKDPRFQEAVEQREKERKKALKVKKAQESYDKMIAKLKQMAEKLN